MSNPSSSLLQISGESGGGQILRSALSLSMVTGRPFRMVNIRGKRPKPGLMRQHLTCVKAAAAVCEAAVDGAEIGSCELVFAPGKVRPGDYAFSIGSGGSTSLVFQTLLPALLHGDGDSTLRIEGGTHNPMAPPFEFLAECFLPVLARMGGQAAVGLERPGFMQAGGGVLTAEIQPLKKWKKLVLLERGGLRTLSGRVLQAHMHQSIAKREVATSMELLGWERKSFSIREASESAGPGNALLLGAEFENVSEICTGIAQQGTSAESVAEAAVKGLRTYLASSAPVGAHLADQLLLPAALAGAGDFNAVAVTNHVRTNMALIAQFLPVDFAVTEHPGGVRHIRVMKTKA